MYDTGDRLPTLDEIEAWNLMMARDARQSESSIRRPWREIDGPWVDELLASDKPNS